MSIASKTIQLIFRQKSKEKLRAWEINLVNKNITNKLKKKGEYEFKVKSICVNGNRISFNDINTI